MTKPIDRPRKKAGRKPTYDAKRHPSVAKEMTLLGATDVQIAKAFRLSITGLMLWKDQYPALLAAIKEGKKESDERVVESLYKRATGYSHPDTHISVSEGVVTKTAITKHYPPDATSMIFWLKNRRPAEWREKAEHQLTGKDGGPLIVSFADLLATVDGAKTEKI